ncbi:MAG: DNA primase [Chloroflexi bacterium]|nr:MAG: DNA primase [Chloroflexota bacterium]
MNVADEVKARLDIVDIVSETVSLRKSGRNYVGFCPFHPNTDTPAFVVFPETQTWHCFGACAEGGDLFSFVMKREGYSFKEALTALARQAGIELEERAAAEGQKEQYDRLLQINAEAAAYFHHLLTRSPAAEFARNYLARRGLTAETIATFQLGYALDAWEALRNHFGQRGYSPEELATAGLLVERDGGTPGYDRFRNRLMIPIRDSRGRVIGFGARALAEDQQPKYMNSPQTPVFDKSRVLFGMDLARKAIRQNDEVVIVEGYMDVIQAHQQGERNVVAQMGTSLTEPQLRLIAPLARRIVLALDADAAGNAAVIRSLSVARQSLPQESVPTPTSRGTIAYEGHIVQDIYIAALPAGKDPDDILREEPARWRQIINAAQSSLDYYESLILRQNDTTTPQGKSAVVRELMPVYRDIKDNIEKEARVQSLARRLGLDERLLLAELRGSYTQPSRPRSRRRKPAAPVVEPPAEVGGLAEKPDLGDHCLSLIIARPETLAAANELLIQHTHPEIRPEDFQPSEQREIFKVLQVWTALPAPTPENLLEMADPSLAGAIERLNSRRQKAPPPPPENLDKALGNAILRLRRRTVEERITELQHLQQDAEAAGDDDSVRIYIELARQQVILRDKIDKTLDALSLTGKRRTEERMFS